MGIHFTYKTKEQSIFRNDLIPGMATSGINGTTGKNGTNGPSIHFSDYSPNNDYIKNMMREKIRKNLVLSSGSTISMQGIKYVNGDIILSKDFLVYRLEMDDENIDFTFLGILTDKQKDDDLIEDENLINNIGDIEFKNFQEGVFDISIPSNRCIDSSSAIKLKGYDYKKYITGAESVYSITDYPDSSTMTTYENTFKRTFGFSFKPIINVTDDSLRTDWDFYLRIYTKIHKSPQYNSYILKDNNYETLKDPVHKSMQGAFTFYKYAEIKLNATYNSSYQTDINSLAAVYNITDMSCDKLHPAGNNINSNYIHSHNFKIGKPLFGISQRIRIGGIDNLNLLYFLTYGPGSIRTGEPLNSSQLQQQQNEEDFAAWSMEQFQTRSYNNQRGYLQYSLYDNGQPNFRSGDSAYFSGMYNETYTSSTLHENPTTLPVSYIQSHLTETSAGKNYSYDNFIKHERILNSNTPLLHEPQISHIPSIFSHIQYIAYVSTLMEKSYICNKLYSFIFNQNNTYELACVNKKTGVVKILNTKIKISTN